MRYLLLRVFVLICCIHGAVTKSFGNEIDSLKLLITQAPDTTKVNLMLRVGKESLSQNGEVDTLIVYAHRAYELAKRIQYNKGIVQALIYEGNGYSIKSEVDRALEIWKQGLKEAERIGDLKGIADFNNNLGYYYQHVDKYEEAVNYYLQAANRFEELKDYDGMGVAMANVATIFTGQGQFEKSLNYLGKCKSILHLMTEATYKCSVYKALSTEYSGMSDLNITFLDSSLKYASLALELAKSEQLIEELPGIYNVFGSVSFTKGEIQTAIQYCKMVGTYQWITDDAIIFENYVRLSECYSALDNEALAFTYLDSAKKMTLEVYAFGRMIAAERDYLLHKKYGRYEGAMRALEDLRMLEDSLLGKEKNEKINELELKYNKASNERAILELSQQKKISDLEIQVLWIGLIALFLIALVVFIFYRQKGQKNKLEKLVAEQRLNHARMNPHFVFNAINSIQHFIISNDKDNAYSYLGKFSKLIRSVLDNTLREYMPLSSEIDSLKIYIELEQLRFKEPFHFDLNIDPSIDLDEYMIPSMLVQPFVENAIKHGLMPKKSNGNLIVSFTKVDHQLKVMVEDNGIGRKMAAESKSAHQSAGMNITVSRLQMLNKRVRLDMKLTITDLMNQENEAAGTRVEFFVPITN
jgi:two-component system LytT family sensor kinase